MALVFLVAQTATRQFTLQDGLAAAYELDGSYASRLAASPAFVNSQAGWVH